MNCFKCQEDILSTEKHLSCILCQDQYHCSCLSGIKDVDYEYILKHNAKWKCPPCDRKTKTINREDSIALSPQRSKSALYKTSGSDSISGSKICNNCKKGFSHNAYKASCTKCSALFHFKCCSPILCKEDYSKSSSSWVCSLCAQKAGSSRKRHASNKPDTAEAGTVLSPDVYEGNISLADILNEMISFRKEVKETNNQFTDSLQKYSDWMEENTKKIDDAANKLTVVANNIETLFQENVNLKRTVNELKTKINTLEQAQRENEVEIHGVPSVQNENLIEILKNLSSAIDCPFEENMVNKCYRHKAAAGKSGGIVVRFVRNIDMQRFVEKRLKKRNVNSRDLGFMGGEATPVYVNSSLTPEKKKLLNAARDVKKEKNYTYLWVRNGRIYMRKNPGERFYVIDSEEDLKKLA